MQDENREKQQTEPQEVVSWYVRPEGQEVVDCYVQPRPMPAGAVPPRPAPPKKRSRKGLWAFLIAAGVLAAVVVTATVIASRAAASYRPRTAERETAATPAAS